MVVVLACLLQSDIEYFADAFHTSVSCRSLKNVESLIVVGHFFDLHFFHSRRLWRVEPRCGPFEFFSALEAALRQTGAYLGPRVVSGTFLCLFFSSFSR